MLKCIRFCRPPFSYLGASALWWMFLEVQLGPPAQGRGASAGQQSFAPPSAHLFSDLHVPVRRGSIPFSSYVDSVLWRLI